MKRQILAFLFALSLLCIMGASSIATVKNAAFPDVAADAWYADAVSWAAAEGIITGYSDGRFAPDAPVTRAQLAVILWRAAGSPSSSPASTTSPDPEPEGSEDSPIPKVTLQVGTASFTATLEENETTRTLIERLPMTITMGELNGNEKYYYLPDSLPTAPRQPGSLRTGDLMLYGSDCLVLFYESFSSSYSYTRLGGVDDPAGLATVLGSGSVEITFRVA